jgi:hypothetical protein
VRVIPSEVKVVDPVGNSLKVWVPTTTSPPGPPIIKVVPSLTTVDSRGPIVKVWVPMTIISCVGVAVIVTEVLISELELVGELVPGCRVKVMPFVMIMLVDEPVRVGNASVWVPRVTPLGPIVISSPSASVTVMMPRPSQDLFDHTILICDLPGPIVKVDPSITISDGVGGCVVTVGPLPVPKVTVWPPLVSVVGPVIGGNEIV